MRSAYLRFGAAPLAAIFLAGCHSSPMAPSPVRPSTPATAGVSATTTGRTIDALSGTPLSSITISLDNGQSATTGADGAFQLTVAASGQQSVTAAGPGVVTRQTTLVMPAPDTALSLIPSQFDLAAFDEMCRPDGSLHRWTTAPSLVIIDAVLDFTGVSDSSYAALGDRLTAADIESIKADLTWGIAQATGGRYQVFASVTVESPAPGSMVNYYSRDGAIVVARFSGLSARTGRWGYGSSATRDDAVVAGAVLLDRDFDASNTCYGRSLRVHELGHALGYSHVTRRQSFMNASAVNEPTDFDRDAVKVAFQRAPGNQSPDRDGSNGALAQRSEAGSAWGLLMP